MKYSNNIWRAEFDPWGNQVDGSNPLRMYQPIRMQGQHYDEESGLHYNRHRYYDPTLGRYITQDPIGLLGGWDGYAYGCNNPGTLVHPLGLDVFIVNRDLSALGETASQRWNPLTHTFTAVTDENGNVLNTYSWGNDANLKGWNKDQSIDINTAKKALQKSLAEKISLSNDCISDAFSALNKKENENFNSLVVSNCKAETNNLMVITENICKSKYGSPLMKINPSTVFGGF
jgi:RHS repeat-associated protein